MTMLPLDAVRPATIPGPVDRLDSAAPAAHPFGRVIDQLLGQANTQQAQANQAIRDLMLGRVDNVHDVTLALAKADLRFRLILEIRNRLTEAYQEITRMQI